MKTDFRLIVSCALALGLVSLASPACGAEGADTRVAKGNNINIRGLATVHSEILGQLNNGDVVTVVDTVTLTKPKDGDASTWLKIILPETIPVWVHAAFVNLDDLTVNVPRLNVRGGPGENFSVVGRLERGAKLKEIRRKDDWIQITPLIGTYGFVAADFLSKSDAPPVGVTPPPPPVITPPPPPPVIAPPPPPPPPTVVVEPPPPVVVAPPPPVTPPVTVTPPATLPETDIKPPVVALPRGLKTNLVIEIESAPKRIVTREGMLRFTAHVNVPSWYQLEALDTKKTINYVHSPNTNVVLGNYRDRRVIVIGEEALDKRWPNTPVLTVRRPEDIHILE